MATVTVVVCPAVELVGGTAKVAVAVLVVVCRLYVAAAVPGSAALWPGANAPVVIKPVVSATVADVASVRGELTMTPSPRVCDVTCVAPPLSDTGSRFDPLSQTWAATNATATATAGNLVAGSAVDLLALGSGSVYMSGTGNGQAQPIIASLCQSARSRWSGRARFVRWRG